MYPISRRNGGQALPIPEDAVDMQILPRSILRVGRVGFDPTRFCRWWWPPALARRDAPHIASSSANPDLGRLSRLDHHCGSIYKPWSLIPFVCGSTKCENTNKTKELIKYHPTVDDKYSEFLIPDTSHRDGAIYKNESLQNNLLEGDIADRNETRLEPMMFSRSTSSCLPDPENCQHHFSAVLFQFFCVRLSRSPISSGSTQLYGYIAARDERDGMLNYIVNYSRDDPIVIPQGSLIEMTGPKRCILMETIVIIEFDMRIKTGLHEDDDQQLIDGAIACPDSRYCPSTLVTHRLRGGSGSVDISIATIEVAVEATIEVVISPVLNGLNLSLSSFVDINDVYKEIQLFHGKVDQAGAVRRFVVAVPLYTMMLLKFEVCNGVESSLSGCATQLIKFQAKKHGCASQQMKLKVVTMAVKVTWSTI